MGEENGYDCKYEKVGTEENSKATYDAENNTVTITDAMASETRSVNRNFLYLAACTANLAAFTCGEGFGWTSPEIPKLKSLDDNPLNRTITSSEDGWIGSFLPLGAALGPFAAGMVADKLGRKKTLLLGTAPFVLTFLMSAFGTNVNMYFLSRFISGLAVGCIFTVLPMYIGEISDNEVRGQLGSFMQLFITVGLLFSYVLGPYMSFKSFNLACLAAPIIFLAYFFMKIPESPYFLILSGDKDGAENSLIQLRNKDKAGVQKEIEEIKLSVDDAQANKKTFFDIFKSKGLTKALIISVGLVASQQFSGINVVLFYAQDIFNDAKTGLAAEICTIIIGVVQVLASACTPILVEKKGKRFLLLVSAVGMAVSQGALAYFFYLQKGDTDLSKISWLPIASLVCYIITYCLGFGPLPWAVMGELFPGEIKAAASTVTASGCWVLGFLITKYFSIVADAIGKDGSFGFFALCCLVAAAFVFKFVPETSGKSVQEIQDILNGVSKE